MSGANPNIITCQYPCVGVRKLTPTYRAAMIIETILRGIADPETLSPLLPPPETA